MNRLKYRVWITPWGSDTTPYMHYIEDLHLGAEIGNWERGGYKDAVFQQYTGLKDTNGNDIYEGDILKYNDLYYEVMWADYQWIATCPYYNRFNWPKFEYFGREARASIVCGNIFENPELLKTNE